MPYNGKKRARTKHPKKNGALDHASFACGRIQMWLYLYAERNGLAADELAAQVGTLLISEVAEFQAAGKLAAGAELAGGVLTRS